MSLPGGPLHPKYKHGRFSKIMSTSMKEAYDRAIRDEDLLSIREEIALHNAMIVERMGRLTDLSAATKLWDQLMREVSDLCERKSRLTTREFQRLRDMRQLLTQERATAIIVALATSVREHVTDPEQVRQIAYDFSLLLEHRGATGTGMVVDAAFDDPEDTPPP